MVHELVLMRSWVNRAGYGLHAWHKLGRTAALLLTLSGSGRLLHDGLGGACTWITCACAGSHASLTKKQRYQGGCLKQGTCDICCHPTAGFKTTIRTSKLRCTHPCTLQMQPRLKQHTP